MSFESWLLAVDAALERRVGLAMGDLPDADYWSLYAGGATPDQAALHAVRNAAGEDPDEEVFE
jgi:hypothetical protein